MWTSLSPIFPSVSTLNVLETGPKGSAILRRIRNVRYRKKRTVNLFFFLNQVGSVESPCPNSNCLWQSNWKTFVISWWPEQLWYCPGFYLTFHQPPQLKDLREPWETKIKLSSWFYPCWSVSYKKAGDMKLWMKQINLAEGGFRQVRGCVRCSSI